MLLVPIDNILDDPMMKIRNDGVIIINKALAILLLPSSWDVTNEDLITLRQEDGWTDRIITDPKTKYLHIYIVEADAHRIAISMDFDPENGIKMTYYDEDQGYDHTPYENYNAKHYACESESLVRWLTATFDYKFDTHAWCYHRIDHIDIDPDTKARIIRMV